jgi:hypothetical protein
MKLTLLPRPHLFQQPTFCGEKMAPGPNREGWRNLQVLSALADR